MTDNLHGPQPLSRADICPQTWINQKVLCTITWIICSDFAQ